MAARKTKPKSADSQAQPDPKSPLDSAALLKAATPILKSLAADLLSRADNSPSITKSMQARHEKERSAERTADNYDTWRRDFVEQVAAAWFLSCVFVRTLEDRGLIDRNRLAGLGAEDSQRAFFALVPSLNERDYLLTVFRELQQLPAAKELFDARHNPVWLLGPGAEAAKELLGLFRTPQADAPMFRFGNADSRFLGDLYQDISENVRKRYALLQTPRFVERFILDRTLDPAIERFGLNDTNLIDPTCGSGHFLLGAFDRLFERRLQAEPALDVRQAAAKALDAVAGSDVNPYAVAIAKFRLTLSFIEKAGYARLKDAPKLPLHVVVADSLLHNPYARGQQSLGDLTGASVEAWKGAEFKLEDEAGAKDVLYKRYAAVVGNPPYITVKDASLRERYRKIYPDSAAGKYSLAAPYCERFFQLGRSRGYVGMITANSFMKREFGKKLIEKYLNSVNLETVINTSGAYIPGHGTPTVLLFGTQEKPQSETVLTVLASRGEPSTPDDPEQGFVWSSIASHWSEVTFENEYITVARTARDSLAKHPWSLGGGGATELKELLEERAEKRLGDIAESIGISSFTLEDDVYLRPMDAWSRLGAPETCLRPMVIGETIRDWSVQDDLTAFFPYDKDFKAIPDDSESLRLLWPWRTNLANNMLFGGKTKVQGGLKWHEFGRLTADKLRTPLTITFAEVATHNHFVLDRGGKVFKQTAPIVKLPASATEDDHHALLAYLNSSTTCFWMKQSCMNKGGSGIGRGIQDEAWESRFQFDGTKLRNLPLPNNWQSLASLGKTLVAHADEFERVMPATWLRRWGSGPPGEVMCDFGTPPRDLLQRLVALQEEVDWAVYRLFDILDDSQAAIHEKLIRNLYPRDFQVDERHTSPSAAELAPGSRPFEQLLDPNSTQWFQRNQYSNPIPPEDYAAGMCALLRARVEAIQAVRDIQIIEQPEYKHRWTVRDVDAEALSAITDWGCSTLEATFRDATPQNTWAIVLDWTKTQGVRAGSATQKYFGGDAKAWAGSTLISNSAPFLAAHRFTDSGLEKYATWEETWANQRREDAGEPNVTCAVPPKYAQEDFRDANCWRLRGKLDVPKERFISYPGCESDEDHEPVYGWAGWNHLQRAQALAQLYNDRRAEGWRAARLVPMLAGLLELLPWLLQWHNEPSEELGGQRPGEQFALFLEGQCAEWGLTHEDLRSWRPAAKRGRVGRKG